MKTIKQMNNMKLKLEYGTPMISRLERSTEKFYLNIVIPGVADGEMIFVLDPGKMMVEHEVDSKFVDKFRFFIYSDDVDFENVAAYKRDGILYLDAPIFQGQEKATKSFSL